MEPARGITVAGRYELVRELSRRGATTVWEANDPILNRRVAIKFLHPSLSADDALRANIEREIKATAGLVHPNIVALYDAGRDDDRMFMVTEFVAGRDVARALAEQGPYAIADAVNVAEQVSQALAYAHAHGVAHHNLKPANVLVTETRHVKISDFALASARRSGDATEAGGGTGTARYLAPEQLRGDPADAPADVYALALILYEMLAGTSPGASDSALVAALARVDTGVAPLHQHRRDVPPRLEATLERALAPHAADRPSAAAFADALAPFRNEHTPPAGIRRATPDQRPRSGPNHAPRGRDRRALIVMVSFVAIAVVLALFALRLALTDQDRTGPATTLALRPLPIAGVRDFDPEGDNQRENPSRVGLAVDNDPTTAWTSETYSSANFGGGKNGVGLIIDLDTTHQVAAVRVQADPGWQGEVAVSDAAPDDRNGFGAAVATMADAPNPAEITLQPPAAGRRVLLWFTGLAGPGRIRVAEIEVLGT